MPPVFVIISVYWLLPAKERPDGVARVALGRLELIMSEPAEYPRTVWPMVNSAERPPEAAWLVEVLALPQLAQLVGVDSLASGEGPEPAIVFGEAPCAVILTLST